MLYRYAMGRSYMMITPIMSVFFRPSGSPITKVDMAPKKLRVQYASGSARRSAR